MYTSYVSYEKYIFYSCRYYLVVSISVEAPVSEPLPYVFKSMVNIFLFYYVFLN